MGRLRYISRIAPNEMEAENRPLETGVAAAFCRQSRTTSSHLSGF